MDVARELGSEAIVIVNLSGRGDKDLATVEKSTTR
jgi:tryptophan synthase beta subunit